MLTVWCLRFAYGTDSLVNHSLEWAAWKSGHASPTQHGQDMLQLAIYQMPSGKHPCTSWGRESARDGNTRGRPPYLHDIVGMQKITAGVWHLHMDAACQGTAARNGDIRHDQGTSMTSQGWRTSLRVRETCTWMQLARELLQGMVTSDATSAPP